MRINKYIATQGICSRRKAEEFIINGKVKINGQTITNFSTQIDIQKDHVEIDQQSINNYHNEKVYYALHKPRGYITSTKKTETENKNFLDLLPKENFPRVFPVGRLDKDSSGLLILTNDGDFSYQLTHPSFQHEKEYIVEIFNEITEKMISDLKKPFNMLGSKTKKAKIEKIGPRRLKIVLQEGKNRQIRRMIRSIGSGVKTLKRVRIEKYRMPKDLKIGQWKQIKKEDVY